MKDNDKINYSTLLGFKAEIDKKINSFKSNQKSLKNPYVVPKVSKKKQLFKSDASIDPPHAPGKVDEEDLVKSRQALERKAKLYESYQKEELEVDGENEDILIDFDSKVFQPQPQTNKDHLNEIFNTENQTSRMIEIVDEFGRTRLVSEEEASKYNVLNLDISEVEPKFYDSKKEIRDKGIGYYRLSTDFEERKKQLEQLNELREKTKSARAAHITPSQKRKLAIEERRKKLLKVNTDVKSKSNDKENDEFGDSVTQFLSSIRLKTFNKN